MQVLRALTTIAVVSFVAACSDNGPTPTPHVAMVDQCDSASFNAGVGAGTCKTAGSVTFAQFNSELSAQHSVAAWHFEPTSLTLKQGDTFGVTNSGGEVHTFTEVANFGGGVVPALNTASGNPTEAPECTTLTAEAFLQPGASITEGPETSIETAKYQCCIHPWMRMTVTVVAR